MLAILVFAALSLLFFRISFGKPGGKDSYCIVSDRNDAVLAVFPLDADAAQTFSASEYAEDTSALTVTVTISGGQARVTAADCSDQICVRTGAISRPGEAIACVPSGILVRIVGETEDEDFRVG